MYLELFGSRVKKLAIKSLGFLLLIANLQFSFANEVVEPKVLWYSSDAGGYFNSIDEVRTVVLNKQSARYEDCLSTAAAEHEQQFSHFPYMSLHCTKMVPAETVPYNPTGYNTVDGEPTHYAFAGDYVTTDGDWYHPPKTTVIPLLSFYPIQVHKSFYCPDGFTSGYRSGSNMVYYGPICKKNSNQQPVPEVCPLSPPSFGNPINVATGNKQESETDFSTADGVLSLQRNYLNQREGWQFAATSTLIDLTARQTRIPCYGALLSYTTYDLQQKKVITKKEWQCYRYLSTTQAAANEVFIQLSNSSRIRFVESSGNFTADTPYSGRLQALNNSTDNNGATWLHTHINNTQDFYAPGGQLLRTIYPTGRYVDYHYSGYNVSSISDDAGRSLQFAYNDKNQISTVTQPDNGKITYEYNEDGNLVKVTWPDASFKTYLYDEPAFISASAAKNLRALTGKIDENGNRNGSYKYDGSGRGVSTELANGVNKFAFTSSTVTDPLGSVSTFGFKKLADDTTLLASQSQPAGSGCAASSKNLSYTTNGLISQKTEFNGNITLYGYNSSNLEDRRVEGLKGSASTSLLNTGAALPAGARKISSEWHPDWRKATRIAEPKKITTYVYHGQLDPFAGGIASCVVGSVSAPLLCKKVEQATTDANGAAGFNAVLDTTLTSREWRYTYNSLGKPLTVVAPDNILTTTVGSTYTYYTSDSSNWKTGDLQQVSNALGQTTRYQRYDPNGRPLDILNADGSRVLLTYDLRGRLLTSSLDGETTTLRYDLAGNLTGVTSPTGVITTYGYDAAHRLTSVTDHSGNRIDYTLDNAGNITTTNLRDTGGSLRYQQQKIYDALSRVKQVVDSQNHATTYLYDASGNPTGVTDPNNQTTSHSMDALDQLKLTTDALNGKTDYSYDGQGHITQVKDPKGNSTVYSYNAFGELISQTSPDTGITTFTYDAAGRRTSATDARSVVTNYSYDSLNRITSVSYPAASTENITYTYDSTANGSYGVGRLASMSTAVSRQDYVYNHRGQITAKYTQLGSTLTTINYRYDVDGNLTGMTYPSGRIITYVRDTTGRVQSLTTQLNSSAPVQTLLSALSYLPFGPASSYTYGNGLSHSNSFDNDYRLTSIQVGGVLSRGYSYDLADNISAITNGISSAKSQNFSYDPLNRLTSATGIYGTLGYSYDAVGNRLTETASNAGTTTINTYTIAPTSNRLTSISKTVNGTASGTNRSFLYDNNGNRTKGSSEDNTIQDYIYNKANRLDTVKVNSSLAGTYQYNALGQRVSKTAGTTKELYHYDEAGQLIAVTDESGNPVREYIYNGSQLVSFIATAGTPIPTTTGYIPTAQATLQNAVYATTNSGYTAPNGYIQFNGEGQSNWPLTTTATADYTLQFSYALGTATRYMDLYVDGIKKANIKFGTTGSWTVWKTVSTTLNLTAGNHTIILKTTGTSGPNLDRIAVTAVAGQSGGPVATTYYVHNDHQNTPQVVTNQNQQVVFMADYQPFGKLQPNQTNTIELYSRFPGQFIDSETGLYQNYFRDYDPTIGRYLQSDPIGLQGGINTYAYVGGNPISRADPKGLFCVSDNGSTACFYPGGPAFRLPTPVGFPDTLSPNAGLYHSYDVKRPIGCRKPSDVFQAMANNPTPGNPLPASPMGSTNNAVVLGQNNIVSSYTTTDIFTGAPLAINITGSVGLFGPGYVVHYVEGGMAHTAGEGLNWKQSPSITGQKLQDFANESLWGAQMDDLINQCGCNN